MSDTFASKPKSGEPWDVVVVGSGPAGLTAAIYTTRGAASTLILAGSVWGGQLMLTTTVDNYPGFPEGIQGPDLMEKMKSQAVRFGAEFKTLDVTKVDFGTEPFEIFSGEENFLAKSVIIATGAQTVWLEAPGVKEFIGKGVSSCAPCDAPFFKDKKVVVVGGGDSAMEEALVLIKYATEVTIVHRRDQFRASKIMQEKVLKNPKIKVLWNSEMTEVKGQEKVNGISVKNNKTGEISELFLDGVFIAIGHKPMSDIFDNYLRLDERGYISKSEISGIFVAGDVNDATYKQAVTAAGYGCMAGMDALKYLEEKKGG